MSTRAPVDVCPAEREALDSAYAIARMGPSFESVSPPAPGANRSSCIIAFPHNRQRNPVVRDLSHCDGNLCDGPTRALADSATRAVRNLK